MLKWRRGLPTGAERAATGADSSGRPGDPKTAGTWARTRSWHMAPWHYGVSSSLAPPTSVQHRTALPRPRLLTTTVLADSPQFSRHYRYYCWETRCSDATECGSTTGCRVVRGVYNNEVHSIEVNLYVSIFLTRTKCPKCFKLKRIRTEHCCSTILFHTQENYEH